MEAVCLNYTDALMWCYDAWAPMRSENLTKDEKNMDGAYKGLSLENTKNNLRKYSDNIVFSQGLIPKILEKGEHPKAINWLHIDLNSSLATTGGLDFFYDRLVSGGVVLFDDYSWQGYEETKLVVDNFLLNKVGTLIPLPTGQAFFIKG